MATSMKTVLKVLNAEEPNYNKALQLGAEALPFLKILVQGDDVNLAAKAAYLAGIMAVKDSADILHIAIQSEDPSIRVAAASTLSSVPQKDLANRILGELLSDEDFSVCLTALKSAGDWINEDLSQRIKDIGKIGDNPLVREEAKKVLKRAKKSGSGN